MTSQYDGLSRLVGAVSAKTGVGLLPHFNACRWDAAWRLAQPCGNSGQLALMGANVTRSSLFWTFVHAPGIDEALLLLDRTDNFFVNKRLQAVTDGRGQLLAIADSAGFITEAYAGSGHDQSSWQGAGLTTQAQSYNPRKWQTDDTWGGIQQFRNRAYDPATGTWIQEDPMGVAGGVNVYRFNNGNPVSFGDPFGLMSGDSSGTAISAQAETRDTCESLVREFSFGVSGIAGVGLIGSLFVGGGVTVGFNDRGQIFLRATASGSAGVGTFGGVGVVLGVARSASTLPKGISKQVSSVAQANVGLGYSVGGAVNGAVNASGTTDCGVTGAPFARAGVGYGVQASVGVQQDATYATKPLLACKAKSTQ